ncbi:MAG: GntR family transcriptional regulator [Pseudonocardiales bacterium]
MSLEAPRSQYRQVADLLRDGIESGEFDPGSSLPSEPELASRFGVSRVTINRAVQLLRGEGLVKVLRGRGTVVRTIRATRRNSSQRYRKAAREESGGRGAFDFEIRRLGLTPRTEIVQLEAVQPPPEAAGVLRLHDGEQVLIRKRQLFASDEPVMLATSYIPWEIAQEAGITKVDTGPGGIYSRLADISLGPVKFSEDVRVRIPTTEEVSFFSLSETQQVFEIVHISLLADGRAVEYRVDTLPTFQWILHFDWDAETSEGEA